MFVQLGSFIWGGENKARNLPRKVIDVSYAVQSAQKINHVARAYPVSHTVDPGNLIARPSHPIAWAL